MVLICILITIFLFWIFKFPRVAQFAYSCLPPRKIYTTEQQITERGFPYEKHTLTTEDGYILTIFRMYKTLPATGEVVLMQHGLMADSTDFVPFDDCIAFRLVELGWDVWLGNNRGSLYCRRHERLSPSSKEFWAFSFHEMGTKDLPAMITYIQHTTKTNQIVYVGYSNGCAQFFAMASSLPEMNKKIKAMIALSPVCGLRHAHCMLPVLYRVAQIDRMGPGGSFLRTLGLRGKLLGFYEMPEFCQPFATFLIYSVLYPIVNRLFSGILLRSNSNFPHPEIVANCFEYCFLFRIRNGTSAYHVMHFSQSLADDYYFHQRDRGKKENLQVYGQRRPPKYNLTNITTHVALVWSQTDPVVVGPDLKALHDKLPNKSKLFVPNYKHLDFTCSVKEIDKIMDHIVKITRNLPPSQPVQDIPVTSNAAPSGQETLEHRSNMENKQILK